MFSLVICSFALCFVFYWSALYFVVVQSLVQFRTLFTVIVVELSKGIFGTKAKYDGKRACEIVSSE